MTEHKTEKADIEHYANCEGGDACECVEIARIENGDICHEFVDTGRCGHSDVEHDAMADGRLDDFEYTLTRRALRQIRAEAWARGYEARRGEDPHGPGESNPHLTFLPGGQS